MGWFLGWWIFHLCISQSKINGHCLAQLPSYEKSKISTDATGRQALCRVWHTHYNSLLNSSRDISKNEILKRRVAAVDYVDRYNVRDISRVISKLKKNKSPGADMLCGEHFIYASDKLHVMLTMLFNSISLHENIRSHHLGIYWVCRWKRIKPS